VGVSGSFINIRYLNIIMKIRKVLDKKVGDTEYQKYLITLPKNIVKESNLLGKELKVKLEKGKIVIEKE